MVRLEPLSRRMQAKRHKPTGVSAIRRNGHHLDGIFRRTAGATLDVAVCLTPIHFHFAITTASSTARIIRHATYARIPLARQTSTAAHEPWPSRLEEQKAWLARKQRTAVRSMEPRAPVSEVPWNAPANVHLEASTYLATRRYPIQ